MGAPQAVGWRAHLAALALFVAAELAFTWPQIATLSTHNVGEKLLLTTYIGRFLLETPVWTWLSPSLTDLNYPDAGSAVLVALPQFLLAKLFALALAPVPAINLSLLLHQALGGYAGFRLGLRCLGPRTGSDPRVAGLSACPGGSSSGSPSGPSSGPERLGRRLISLAPALTVGFGFGFSAHALSVFANGQPENYGFVYVALALEAAWVLVDERRWLGLPALMLATTAAFLSSPYLVMAGLVGAWPLGLYALVRRRGPHSFAGAGGLAAVCALMFRHFQGATAGTEGRLLCPEAMPLTVEASRVFKLGEDSLSALLRYPPVDHDVMVTDLVRALLPVRHVEGFGFYGGYLGPALLVLAILGARELSKTGRWLFALCAGVPFVLSMGPRLVLNGWVIYLDSRELLLPLAALQRAPGLSTIFETVQFPERLIPGATLPLALAAGLGVAALLARRPSPALAAALVLLLPLDQALLGPVSPPLPVFAETPPQAYLALAARDDRAAVVDVPPLGWSADREVYGVGDGHPGPPPVNFMRALVRGAATHGHPVPYGGCMADGLFFNAGAQRSELARVIGDVVLGQLSADSLGPASRGLSDQGYGYLVLHEGTGLLTQERERALKAAFTQELDWLFSGEDGTHLYKLKRREPEGPPSRRPPWPD